MGRKVLELTGQQFGEWLVLERASSSSSKDNFWHCLCSCGNKREVSGKNLKSGQSKSCGHIRFINLKGRRFGKLLVLERVPKPENSNRVMAFWNCLCDCGKYKILRSECLLSGEYNSCGCGKLEKEHKDPLKAKISSAKVIYSNHEYNDGDLLFEDFFKLTFEANCFYCGSVANNCFNNFKNRKGKKGNGASDFAIEHGTFIYSGLDRINNNLPHNLDNVVPCCFICNRFKLDRNLEDFGRHVQKLKLSPNLLMLDRIKLQDEQILLSIFSFKNKKNTLLLKEKFTTIKRSAEVRDLEFNLEKAEVYNLIIQNCSYCDYSPLEIQNFNGLDRINNELGYIKENVTACCKFCNSAKGTLTIDEFFDWIKCFKTHQEQTQSIQKLIREKSAI